MELNEASRWRIELAEDISKLYTCRGGTVMAVVGGSPARGLSDAASDIDLIIFHDEPDMDFIRSFPLKPRAGEPLLFLDHGAEGSAMELYKIDTLIVEIGHVSMGSWTSMVSRVMEKHDVNPGLQKSLNGFLDSFPVYGKERVNEWKERIGRYPEELARKMIRRNLGFFWSGCIEHQGLDRGETVFFYDALCTSVKRLMALLAGLNRRYLGTQEPRWIEYELSEMVLKPPKMWTRIQTLFKIDPYDAIRELEKLISETVELARREFPDLDYSLYDACNRIVVEKTAAKPEF